MLKISYTELSLRTRQCSVDRRWSNIHIRKMSVSTNIFLLSAKKSNIVLSNSETHPSLKALFLSFQVPKLPQMIKIPYSHNHSMLEIKCNDNQFQINLYYVSRCCFKNNVSIIGIDIYILI